MNRCPFCAALKIRFWFNRKLSHHESYPIHFCDGCRSAFVWPRPSDSELQSFYQANSYGRLSHAQADAIEARYYPTKEQDARTLISGCLKMLHNRPLLDIGAGQGTLVHVARRCGFDAQGVEPNPNDRRLFEELNGFPPVARFFDAEFAGTVKEKYGVVVLNQVLEHLAHPDDILENLSKILTPDGVVVVAVPHFGSFLSLVQGKRDMFIKPPEHLNCFSKTGLMRLFARNGYHLLTLKTVSKVPRARIHESLRAWKVGPVVWRIIYGGMLLSDIAGRGMFLNSYFRMSSSHHSA